MSLRMQRHDVPKAGWGARNGRSPRHAGEDVRQIGHYALGATASAPRVPGDTRRERPALGRTTVHAYDEHVGEEGMKAVPISIGLRYP
jgi:hypothetical protein